MDSGHWISRLAAAKRFYEAQLGHADRVGMDELDMDGDENAARPNFACPYCYEDHDVASLIAHLEEDHPFEPHTVVTIGAAVAAVPVGGATAASGGVAAAAPKGNLHQTQPHNRASRSSRLKTFEEARSPSQQLALYVTEFVMLNFLRNLMYC